MASQLTSQLIQGRLVDKAGNLEYPWYVYFRDQSQQINQGPTRIGSPVELTEQSDSIVTTSLTSETLTAGLYRITYYIRITTADGVASSVRLNIAWTDTVAASHSFTDITGDTTATTGSESYMVNITAQPISYTTTYTSNTPNKMEYSLQITLELMAAA